MNLDNLEKWHFEMNEKACNYLLDLVLKGQKKATSSSYEGLLLSGEEIPKIDSLSVITDWDGNPRCIIKTTNVRILPYKDITFDIAKLEGEDDNLNSWRETHKKFFAEEGKELGYEFNMNMKVVFEEFEVVELL
ncbi:MAG: ASCH domain-containing protein [Acholeplasmatales bacterium]|nr:ASCH domain-containing protein [Acholeplasmatales bacterium]